jgi:hypothetical protein
MSEKAPDPSPPGQARIAPSPPGQERIAPSPPGQARIAPSPPGQERIAPSPPGHQRMQGLPGIINSLGRPSFRKSFFNDPLRAMERAGLDIESISQEHLEILANLSSEDLEVLARVTSALKEAGPSRVVSI